MYIHLTGPDSRQSHPPGPSACCVSRGGALWADASLSCARNSHHRERAGRRRPKNKVIAQQQDASTHNDAPRPPPDALGRDVNSCPQADRLSVPPLLQAKRRQCRWLDRLPMICCCVHIIVAQPAGTLVWRFRLAPQADLASTPSPGCPRAVKRLFLPFFFSAQLCQRAARPRQPPNLQTAAREHGPAPIAFVAWCRRRASTQSCSPVLLQIQRQWPCTVEQQGCRPPPLVSQAAPLHMPSGPPSDTTHATCHHFRWPAGDVQMACPDEATRMPSGPVCMCSAASLFVGSLEVARRT
ncbi:hypothetical protein T440DRAFT_506773 [Plenodomus tracheiphilus IPT5]|uniref:Uncharacterized protein n=1 Tax=Plenodomus tracheiphilus IPT5 TaxID=1408161 RepID=A0A6A7BAK9_9PLEO|nr:hypothetical protein T440DRAFT_506773 [Plenodomus tracheiphilus IPT5]